MKRLIGIVAALCLLFALTACDPDPAPDITDPDVTDAPATSEPTAEPSTEEPTDAPTENSSAAPQEPYELGDSVATAYRDADGRIWAMGIAEIVNTGDRPLFADYGSFVLLDGEDNPVMTVDSVAAYPQIILPGESAYYFEVVEPDLPDTSALQLAPQPLVSESQRDVIRYEVSDARLTDSLYGGLEINGKVKNTTSADGSLVCIAAVLLDGDGSPLGLIYTILTEPLAANAEVEFNMESFMLPTDLKSADVAEIQYFAYPLQN